MNNQFSVWLDKLERYCSFQERCTSEVEQKMNLLKIEVEFKPKLIEELKNSKFLDDKRYTSFYIRAKVRIKRDGVNKIKSALFQKRIPESIINEVMAEIDREIYSENIEKLIEKKWSQLFPKNEYQDAKVKLIRYLMTKGYKYDEFNSYLKLLSKK